MPLLYQPRREVRYPFDVAPIDALPLLQSAMLAVVLHQAKTDHASVAIALPTGRDRGLGAQQAEREVGVDAVPRCIEADEFEVLVRELVAVRAIVGQRQCRLHDPPAQRATDRAGTDADK